MREKKALRFKIPLIYRVLRKRAGGLGKLKTNKKEQMFN